jgi:AraC family transcriptional regulator, transcriptional activator of pobA
LKLEQGTTLPGSSTDKRKTEIAQQLKAAIEEHYRARHSAGDYADLLHISSKVLARITRSFYNKTLTALISERIIIEAKRELYLTPKTVKEIAWLLGFEDEYYFSRFFKINAGVSPQLFRETVGFARLDPATAMDRF